MGKKAQQAARRLMGWARKAFVIQGLLLPVAESFSVASDPRLTIAGSIPEGNMLLSTCTFRHHFETLCP